MGVMEEINLVHTNMHMKNSLLTRPVLYTIQEAMIMDMAALLLLNAGIAGMEKTDIFQMNSQYIKLETMDQLKEKKP